MHHHFSLFGIIYCGFPTALSNADIHLWFILGCLVQRHTYSSTRDFLLHSQNKIIANAAILPPTPHVLSASPEPLCQHHIFGRHLPPALSVNTTVVIMFLGLYCVAWWKASTMIESMGELPNVYFFIMLSEVEADVKCKKQRSHRFGPLSKH